MYTSLSCAKPNNIYKKKIQIAKFYNIFNVLIFIVIKDFGNR